jgi:hypothetical protein
MTRQQFEQLMDANNWPAALRRSWDKFTPKCDADTFNRELARPDGIIEVTLHEQIRASGF